MPRELDSAAAHGGRDYATVQILAHDELGPGGAPHSYRLYHGKDDLCPMRIHFQEGPIQEVGINGITHESLLAVLIDRLDHFQKGPYPSDENKAALSHLRLALDWLNVRTARRASRGVEGKTLA